MAPLVEDKEVTYMRQLVLHNIIEELEKVEDKRKRVQIEGPRGFTNAIAIGSYRGDYSKLMIEYSSRDWGRPDPMSVDDLLGELKGAIGKAFKGYKGGDFTMREDTAVYLDTYGGANGVVVALVEDRPLTTFIHGFQLTDLW